MDELLEKIKKAIGELTTLNIWTVQGDAANSVDFMLQSDRAQAAGDFLKASQGSVALTRIDLLQGDIVSLVPKDNAWLLEYHGKREQQGIAIVNNNLLALRELWKLAMDLKKSEQ